jgi:hypothetical protein
MDQLLASLSLTAASLVEGEHARGRREYRGDRTRVHVDRTLANTWMPSFDKATSGMRHVCTRVVNRYEDRVNRYGYSLRNVTSRVASPYLSQFRLIGFEHGDSFS